MVRETEFHGTPSLASFSHSVELRVTAGVQSVSTSMKKAEEKGEMLEHVKDLVLRATGTLPRSYHFKDPLENVFLKEEGSSWISSESRQTNDKQPVVLPTAFEPRENHSFVRLARSHYFLEKSKQFVIILMQLECQSVSKSPFVTEDGEMGISIMIRPENTVSVAWELDAIKGQQEGNTIWLAARSAVSTLAVTPSLDDQQLTITAHATDERSQFLGAFTMSTLLQSALCGEQVMKKGVEYGHPFFRSFHVVVEGRNAQGIHLSEGNSKGLTTEADVKQINEDLALFSFSVSCRTTLATSVAQLHAGADDDTNIRGTMCISPSSLCVLDNFLILLENETEISRQIAAREDTFGYTLPDIKQILEMQQATDNCLGVMEENYLESWG